MERARATSRSVTPSGCNVTFAVAVAGSTDVTVPKRGWLPPWSSAPACCLMIFRNRSTAMYRRTGSWRGIVSQDVLDQSAVLTEPSLDDVDVIGLVEVGTCALKSRERCVA